MWISYQNLNTKQGRVVGSILKYGRAWLFFKRGNLGLEWNFGARFLHITCNIGGEENDFTLSIALWFFAVWFSVSNLIPRSWLPRPNGRTIGLSYYGGYIWISLWTDRMVWERGKWNGEIVLDIPRLLFGKRDFQETELETHRTSVPMPERSYDATVKLTKASWKRSRWFWPLVILRAHIELDRPIPVPGKGTMAYNCGEDAVYSMCTPAATVSEAVAALVESCLRDREKYGGLNWRPTKSG